MSVNLTLTGSLQTPETTYLTTTSKTDIFTAASDRPSRVVAISVANVTGAAVDVTLEWNDGTNDHVFWHKAVPADDTAIISDLVIMAYGKGGAVKLKATAGTGNAAHVTVIHVKDASGLR